jgi:hypothetical protein
MLKQGLLLKWGSSILLGLIVATAGGFAFRKLSIPNPWQDTTQPTIEILSAEQHRDCSVIIKYEYTNPFSPDYRVFLLREDVAETHSAFPQFALSNKVGPAEFVDQQIPQGNYKWKVGLQLDGGAVKYTDWSNSILIDSDACSKDLILMPANAIVTQTTLTGKCDVDVTIQTLLEAGHEDNYKFFPTDGIRIYREPDAGSGELIAQIAIEDFPRDDKGVGHFYDKNVPAGTYRYQAEMYNSNGATMGEKGEPVVVSDISCKSLSDIVIPEGPTGIQPIVTPTLIQVPQVAIQACVWQAAVNVFLRKGPDVALFDRLVDVEAGKSFPLIGQSQDGKFWVIEIEPGVSGYISKSEKYSRTSGDCSLIPTLQDPEPPVIEPAPTKPANGNGGSAPSVPQCSDGVDNDGDGAIDMRDLRGCTDPNDAVEN